jgi:hypothetical protein
MEFAVQEESNVVNDIQTTVRDKDFIRKGAHGRNCVNVVLSRLIRICSECGGHRVFVEIMGTPKLIAVSSMLPLRYKLLDDELKLFHGCQPPYTAGLGVYYGDGFRNGKSQAGIDLIRSMWTCQHVPIVKGIFNAETFYSHLQKRAMEINSNNILVGIKWDSGARNGDKRTEKKYNVGPLNFADKSIKLTQEFQNLHLFLLINHSPTMGIEYFHRGQSTNLV